MRALLKNRIWLRLLRIAAGGLGLIFAFAAPLRAADHDDENHAPRRVVSINLMTDQWLMLFAHPDQIAGVTALSREPGYSPLWRQARELPVNAGTAEEVLRQKPDLVLAGQWSSRSTLAMLRSFGLRVVVVDYPQDFDGIAAQARQLGRLLGREAEGEAYAVQLAARLAKVRASRPAVPLRVLDYTQNGWTQGAGTVFDLLVREAGHRNLGAELGVRWLGQVSLEQLLLEKPDRLVVPSRENAAPALAYAVFDHPVFQRVTQGRPPIVLPEGTTDIGGPFTIDALEALAAGLQPATPSPLKTPAP